MSKYSTHEEDGFDMRGISVGQPHTYYCSVEVKAERRTVSKKRGT